MQGDWDTAGTEDWKDQPTGKEGSFGGGVRGGVAWRPNPYEGSRGVRGMMAIAKAVKTDPAVYARGMDALESQFFPSEITDPLGIRAAAYDQMGWTDPLSARGMAQDLYLKIYG